MKKSIFLAVLFLILLCGCRKTTYITRNDQISQNSTVSSLHTTDSTGLESSSGHPEQTDRTDSTTSASEMETSVSTQAASKGTSKSNSKKNDSSGNKHTSTKNPTNSGATTSVATTAHTTTHASEETTVASTSLPEETTVPETTAEHIQEKDPYDISGHTVGSMEYSILAAMNEHRAAAGSSSLTLDGYLCAIASVRAYEVSQYWSHNRLDGRSWDSVLSDYGYSASCTAENLCQGSAGLDSNTVVSMWAGSDSHYSNMTDPSFTNTGIGVYHYNGLIFVVCLYAG